MAAESHPEPDPTSAATTGTARDRAPDPVVWFNPALGVAGDMIVAALIDLGAQESVVRDQLERLALPGWQLEVRPTSRRGLTATAVDVTVPDQDHHQPWSRIDALLADGGLESAVADGARRTFAALARAEASVHGIDVDQVNFHEVGALDAIVDVVGAWAALWSLGDAAMPTVASAPVGLGSGTAPMAHGVLPVPAPAVLELLTGHPTTPVDTGLETATPTGVALLVTMADRWGGLPDGVVRASGRGAGTADPPTHPNVLAVVLTDPALADPSPSTGQRVAARLIQTNLDDVTGEVVAHVIDRAIGEGADDAWAVATTAKKGRPGVQLSVLCRPELTDRLARLVASGTGTLGWRERDVDKIELERHTDLVEVGIGADGRPVTVRVKVGPHGAKPEFDDLAALAEVTGRPVRALAAEVLAVWRGDTTAPD